MTEYFRFGVGQRGALPRGAKQYLNCNPSAVRVYLYIMTHEPCCRFPQDEIGLDIATVHGVLARLHSYMLITKKMRINSYKSPLYGWSVNQAYVDKMLVLIGVDEE